MKLILKVGGIEEEAGNGSTAHTGSVFYNLVALPTREQIMVPVEEHLIVELYSK